MYKKNNLFGFILAEVLIILVVIGVIAALTVPNLITKYQEQERVAKIRKVYKTISNAMTYVKMDGGDISFSAVDANNQFMKQWFGTYLLKHLSTTKICYSDSPGCWAAPTKYLRGSTYLNSETCGGNTVSVILNDGSFACFDVYTCTTDFCNIFGVSFYKNDKGGNKGNSGFVF